MSKRFVSLLLALVLLLGTVPAAAAASAEPVDPMDAWLASLGTYTETPVNINSAPEDRVGEFTANEGLTTNAVNDPDAKVTPGAVLFALKEGYSLAALNRKLTALGISDMELVWSDAGENALVWYRASCSGDVQETVKNLQSLAGVAVAEPEYYYYTDSVGAPTEAEMGHNWAASHLLKKGNKLWWTNEMGQTNAPGEGVIVAVIDTGVDYTHEDLVDNMWVNEAEKNGEPGWDDDGNGYIDDIYGVNVTASGKQAGDPMDDNGHGTHVAGIIAMSSNKTGAVGIAWGAKVMAIKAGQSTGSFTSSDIAKAIRYAQMMGADVINMSFGGTEKSYLVEQALASAFADCVLVASAGNDGIPTADAPDDFTRKADIYPAGYSYVLGVMATDSKGNLAGFSNWDYYNNSGAEYELTAPGVDIYSTLPGNRYALWSGTSMAAPCVSAAAAIVRSKFADKDTYSSRFIMGQLASATKDTTVYVDQKGGFHTYAALNIYDSCVYLPKPNISVPEIFLLDNVTAGNEVNDGDHIIDAGETIDMGFTVRNQWGQTGTITVTANAVSDGGAANPYVNFITDTVVLEPAGTFGESDNGYVWDDSYLTAVSNPIRFTLASNTPNDAEIRINLTVTTTNGFDKTDKNVYTTDPAPVYYTFRVQSGRGISGTLTQNTTLTNDYYWIIENALYIPEGITLTVEPGTQIQFWSSDDKDAYGGLTMASIVNEGTLNMIGTEDMPISCFPASGFSDYMVEIRGTGEETLQYCEIINPLLGITVGEDEYPITTIDHCRLIQNQDGLQGRYLHQGEVKSVSGEHSAVVANYLSNSSISGFRIKGRGTDRTIGAINLIDCVLINDSATQLCSDPTYELFDGTARNNVFMSSSVEVSLLFNNGSLSTSIPAIAEIPQIVPVENDTIFTYEGAESKYLLLGSCVHENGSFNNVSAGVREAAEAMGGHFIILNDEEEEKTLKEILWDMLDSLSPSTYKIVELDCAYDVETDGLLWGDGSNYQMKQGWSGDSPSAQKPWDLVTLEFSIAGSCLLYGYMRDGVLRFSKYYDTFFYIIEFPASMSDEEILAARDACDVQAAICRNTEPQMTNNAILNPVLNTDPTRWSIVVAPKYDKAIYGYEVGGNYWGTENKTLINQMIRDANDSAGALGDIIEDPILTLESESLEDIYPFSTAVWLEDKDGNVVTTASPGATYTVHVTYNRDMDQTVQPTVTYGPAKPYTDFSVKGDWVSAREWVGETIISPIVTQGTQFFRTIGGCAADDGWLICGNDTMRFQFHVAYTGALAMTLQATGGPGKVELSWTQDDFDTLAGYNLYRSTSSEGRFVKVNKSILTDITYVDADVQPGTTYYYYFKVVNTEGNEEGNASNVVSAKPKDATAPVITHTPVTSGKYKTNITVSATATDNVAVAGLTLYYRPVGAESYNSRSMVPGENNRYVGTIPSSAVSASVVEYYIAASDSDGNIAYSGTAQKPNRISIDGAPPSEVASGTCGENLTWTLDSDGVLTIRGTGDMDDYDSRGAPWRDYCPEIRSAVIESGVTSIGSYTFVDCSNLVSVEISNSVATIGSYVFSDCNNLMEIKVAPQNTAFVDVQGVLFNASQTKIICYPAGKTNVHYDIPSGVTKIDHGAFCKSKLTTVTIPESVNEVGHDAFSECRNLVAISIPDGVTYIGLLAFYQCKSLISVDIPKSVTRICGYAFTGCSSLTSIVIPEGVITVEDDTFLGCNSLTTVIIPESVTTIGYGAFQGCSALTSVAIPKNVSVIGPNAFYGCTGLTSVEFLGNSPAIGNNAFYGVTATAYYPAGNTTWTEEVMQNYGGELTWVPSETPAPELNTPTLTVTVDSASGSPVLNWNAVPGENVAYVIYRSTDGTPKYLTMIKNGITSFVNSAAMPGNTYQYWVRAVELDKQGNAIPSTYSDYSNGVKILCKCGTPVISVNLDPDSDKPVLSWNKITGAGQYIVYRDGKYYASLTSTRFVDDNAEYGLSYVYTVRASKLNNTGTSGHSNAVTVVLPFNAPVVTGSRDSSTGKPVLTWNPVPGAEKYVIYRSEDGKTFKYFTTTTATSVTNTGAAIGKTYSYYVRAMTTLNGAAIYSANSNVVKITVSFDAPVVYAENDPSTGKPVLSWDSIPGAEKYYVYRSEDGGKTYKYFTQTTATSVTNTGAIVGNTYFYYVRAMTTYNGAAIYSDNSNEVSIFVKCATPVVTVKANAAGKPVLSWQKLGSAASYNIYRYDPATGTYTYIGNTTGNSFTHNYPKYNANGEAYYAVRAISATGGAPSLYSNIVVFKK